MAGLQFTARAASCVVMAIGMVLLAACAPQEHPTPWSSPDVIGTGSCTGQGEYSLAPSVVGPNPALPASRFGPGVTPEIGLSGTKTETSPETVSIVLFVRDRSVGESVQPGHLVLGDEVDYRGYTLKVTSICDSTARRDLLSQEE